MNFRNVVLGGAALLLTGALAACGSRGGLSGEYGQSDAGQWFTILDFQGGGRVMLTMIGSEDRHSGTYTTEGDTVVVTAAGETRTLNVDGNGCLDGGPGNSFFSGTVCRKP
jgi:hypothetical protein